MKKAYDQGTLLMLGDVVERIGCAAAMPKDHKNEWMQNRFSLKPAGRMQIPGMKGSHLVWREADVEKARKLWEERQPTAPAKPIYPKPITIQMVGSRQPDVGAELKAMETETPGWMKPPEDGPALARSMIDLAAQLLHQAQAMLKPGEVPA